MLIRYYCILFGTVLGLVLVAGCTANTQSTQPKPVKEQPQMLRSAKSNKELKLSLELPKQQYIVGRGYSLKVMLTNLSNKDIKLTSPNLIRVAIIDKGGNIVLPGYYGGKLADYTIKKGKSHSEVVPFSIGSPGTYKILCNTNDGVHVKGHSGTEWEPHNPPRLELKPIIITVKQNDGISQEGKKHALKTVWLKDEGSEALQPFISYKDYVYVPANPLHSDKPGEPYMLEYIGSYDDLQVFKSKIATDEPPQWLWGYQRGIDRQLIDQFFTYRRWQKVSGAQLQIMRSTTTKDGLRLAFEVPKQDFKAGTEYTAKVTLINLTDKDLIFSTAGLFELNVLDNSGKLVARVCPGAEAYGDYRRAFAPAVPYSTNIAFKVDKPGNYRVYCRLSGGIWDTPFGSSGGSGPPPDLKTEPFGIVVK
jgi:hypothetical protein